MEATRFAIDEKLGANSARSKEGFVTYFNVPISRTGVLLYAAQERPEIEPGPDGLVRIERLPEDVFEQASLESLQGKPFVNEHHPIVDPANWRDVAAGTVINPRRGEGLFDDCVVADIVVNDASTLEDIEAGKREVSADYTPEYYDLGGGRGRQRKIRFHNVALVESGRCGPRCSVKDHAIQREESKMAKAKAQKPRAWLDKLRGLRDSLTQDQRCTFDEAVEEADKETKDNEGELTEPGKKDRTTADDDMRARMDALESKHAAHDSKLTTHDSAIADHEGRIKGLEDEDEDEPSKDEDKEIEKDLEEEAPPGTGDRKMKGSKDSAMMVPTWRATVALAEIIQPGIRIPTFDSAQQPKVSYKGICDFRRRVLSMALLSADTNQIVADIRAGRTLDSSELGKLSCSEVRTLFYSAGAAKKASNTQDTAHGVGHYTGMEGTGGGLGVAGKKKTPAEVNEENRKRYAGVSK